MGSFSVEIAESPADRLLGLAKDRDVVISHLPGVVSIQGNKVKLRFRRVMLTHESTYEVSAAILGPRMVEYKLADQRGNSLVILFSSRNERELTISVSYSGEREWVVNKAVKLIAKELQEGLRKEVEKLPSVSTRGDYSQSLSKVSFITKLLMKSKLVKSEVVNVKEGELVDYLQEIISQYSQYPVIYISGSGEGSFRLLFVGGEMKGVYVVREGRESLEEGSLNILKGGFKIHVYVALSPKVLEVTS